MCRKASNNLEVNKVTLDHPKAMDITSNDPAVMESVSNNNVVEFVKPREAAEILGVNVRNAC